MSGTTNKFRTTVLWRITILAILPVLAMTLAAWVIVSVAQVRSEAAASQRSAQTMADRLGDRVRSASTLLNHAKVEAVRGELDIRSAVTFPVAASRTFLALLQLNSRGVVEQIALRSDIKTNGDELRGMDLSRLTSVASASDGVAAVVPEAPPLLGEAPEIVLVTALAEGKSLLAVCDTSALLESLEPTPASTAQFLVTSAKGQIITVSPVLPPPILGRLMEANAERQTTAISGFARASGPFPGWSVWYREGGPASVGWNALRLICLGIGAILAIASAIIASLYAVNLARPLRLFAAAAHRATTNGDLSELPTQRYAESEDVARTLRDVFVKLRQERSDRAALTAAVRTASAPTAAPEAIYSNMAAALASVTRARCVLVAEWIPGTKMRARVLGGKCAASLPPDYTYELTGHPASLLTAAQPVNIASQVSRLWPESPLLRLTGAEGYIAIPLLASDGSIAGHIEIIDDHDLVLGDELKAITSTIAARAMGTLEQTRAQARMRESDELYATITQDQKDVICRWTADAAITYANEAMCQLTGKLREQLLGRSLLSLFCEEDGEPLSSNWSGLSAIRPMQTLDLRLMNEHGEPVWHRVVVRALLDGKGRVTQYQGTARDITRLRELTASVADIQARFDVLSENTQTAFWLVDWTTQRCIYGNSAFEKLWDIDLEAAQESSLAWTVAIHEEDRAGAVRNYLLHAAEGQYGESYRIIKADGRVVRIQDQAVPMRNAEGQVYRVANIAFELDTTTEGPHPEPQDRTQ